LYPAGTPIGQLITLRSWYPDTSGQVQALVQYFLILSKEHFLNRPLWLLSGSSLKMIHRIILFRSALQPVKIAE
jgi:hypothetical protein